MAAFCVVRQTTLPAAEAWRRVTDWPEHGAHMPLTCLTVEPPGPTGPGTLIVARTGVGRSGVDDPMEVVAWTPPAHERPGRCRLEKRGAFVEGWAEIEVRPAGAGSRVVWREDVRVRRLPRLFDAATAWGGRLLFGRMLRRLLKN